MRENSLIPDIRYLEAEVRKLRAENTLLREHLKAGYREPKINATREKIRKYKTANPKSTIRAIQKACKISSPSVAHFHLKKIKLAEEMNPHVLVRKKCKVCNELAGENLEFCSEECSHEFYKTGK